MSLFLIEAGAPLDTRQHLGRTLLHEAAIGGDPELVRVLLARGLDVNAVDDHFNDSPLLTAAEHDKVKVVAALLEAGAEVNHQDVMGHTPLRGAIFRDRIGMVQMLLDAGADPMIADHQGQTPLDFARTRTPAIAKLLEQAATRQTSNSQEIP